MEIIKGNGGVPPEQQKQLDFNIEGRIIPLGAPGAFRLLVSSTCKYADQGEGHRRIGAQAEIEIFEAGDQMMDAFIEQIGREWKKIQARAKEQYAKMIEQANRRVQTVPANALDQMKKL